MLRNKRSFIPPKEPPSYRGDKFNTVQCNKQKLAWASQAEVSLRQLNLLLYPSNHFQRLMTACSLRGAPVLTCT